MSFSSKLRQSESHYKLVRQVVDHVCTANSLEFATVWATVCNRPTEYFDRFFRRERRRNDPLNGVKKPRTAFSFFTQEHRPKISEKHPTLAFGEVSKLVGQQWSGLDATTKAKYTGLEQADKARYEVDRQAIMKDIATRAETAQAQQASSAPVVESAPIQASAPVAKKAVAKKTASAPVTAQASAPVTAQASAPVAKKAVVKKTATAPVPAQASAPVQQATAPVAKKAVAKKPASAPVNASA
jgi:hypothetical protein